ncbi:hypothetical protein [Streptomyces buecherae]|uniref:hypothetical protein n=1 Tax=Streptomyces buecherae TaxID=2763006 RepID=UPI0036521B9C
MIHTAVLHTDTSIREALDKSVQKLETASQTAYESTTKEVVDELGRMRANFREVHNKLNSNGDGLHDLVRGIVDQLRTELREVCVALDDLTPPTPAESDLELTSTFHEGRSTEEAGTTLTSAPDTTITEPGSLQQESTLAPLIPEQRTTDEDEDFAPGSVAVEVEAVR